MFANVKDWEICKRSDLIDLRYAMLCDAKYQLQENIQGVRPAYYAISETTKQKIRRKRRHAQLPLPLSASFHRLKRLNPSSSDKDTHPPYS